MEDYKNLDDYCFSFFNNQIDEETLIEKILPIIERIDLNKTIEPYNQNNLFYTTPILIMFEYLNKNLIRQILEKQTQKINNEVYLYTNDIENIIVAMLRISNLNVIKKENIIPFVFYFEDIDFLNGLDNLELISSILRVLLNDFKYYNPTEEFMLSIKKFYEKNEEKRQILPFRKFKAAIQDHREELKSIEDFDSMNDYKNKLEDILKELKKILEKKD